MNRPTDECRIALDSDHDSGNSEQLLECQDREGESVWGVYAWPEWDTDLVAEKGDMEEVASGLTKKQALDRATELGLTPIGL